MRQIAKHTVPVSFANWLLRPGSRAVSWEDFGRIHPDIKREVKDALLLEQGYICCYCEKEVGNHGPPPDAHIEHLMPRSADRAKTYDWSNLLVSCESEKIHRRPATSCGHYKNQNIVDVHPLMVGCSRYFSYKANGEVSPSMSLSSEERVLAVEAIRVLGLNNATPVQLRRAAIAAMQEVLEEAGAPETEEYDLAVAQERARLVLPDVHRRRQPFVSALLEVFV